MSDIQTIQEILGEEAARKLVSHFGGCSLYIPSNAFLDERNQEIIAAYKQGSDYRSLALSYSLSENYIRNIIHYKESKSTQLNLF